MVENGRLSAKQERALEALLLEPNIRAAARSAKVGETTLFRWLNEADFSQMYRAARRKIFDDALSDLQKATGEAVATLRRNLQAESEGAQIRAAIALIELAIRGRELGELEDRISTLEERLSDTQPATFQRRHF